jgi:carbohydrate kinase (thermoresistant glucokinase family)
MKLIIMGVSGCGKTTLGQRLAQALGYDFFDADDYHNAMNVAKMQRGEALNDDDRQDWLITLQALVSEQDKFILACSALKRAYRRILDAHSNVDFIFLEVSQQVAVERLNARADHYMPASLVASQFDSLEPPRGAIRVNAEQSPDRVFHEVLLAINSTAHNAET